MTAHSELCMNESSPSAQSTTLPLRYLNSNDGINYWKGRKIIPLDKWLNGSRFQRRTP
jgi:hypothetical protein